MQIFLFFMVMLQDRYYIINKYVRLHVNMNLLILYKKNLNKLWGIKIIINKGNIYVILNYLV